MVEGPIVAIDMYAIRCHLYLARDRTSMSLIAYVKFNLDL